MVTVVGLSCEPRIMQLWEPTADKWGLRGMWSVFISGNRHTCVVCLCMCMPKGSQLRDLKEYHAHKWKSSSLCVHAISHTHCLHSQWRQYQYQNCALQDISQTTSLNLKLVRREGFFFRNFRAQLSCALNLFSIHLAFPLLLHLSDFSWH